MSGHLAFPYFCTRTLSMYIFVVDTKFINVTFLDIVKAYLENGAEIPEEGIEDSFVVEHEVSEKVRTGTIHPFHFRITASAGR